MTYKQKRRPGGGGDSVVEPAGKQFNTEDSKTALQSQGRKRSPQSLRLYINSRFTGVTVVPDAEWPDMWRIRHDDGRLSDMVNLSRAKDAAITWARPRGLGGGEAAQWHHRETRSEAVQARFSRSNHAEVAAALKPELWTASDAIAAELDNVDWTDWPAEVPA